MSHLIKLNTILNSSRIQSTNNALYQVISELIKFAIDDEESHDLVNEHFDSIGIWTEVPFAANNFTAVSTGAGTATWTVASGDQTKFAISRMGNVLLINLNIATSTVVLAGGAAAALLRVSIPGYSFKFTTTQFARTTQGGVNNQGFAQVPSDNLNYIEFRLTNAAAGFVAGTDDTYVQFVGILQLVPPA